MLQYITFAIGVTSEGGHLLPARGKDPNRGLYVFLHPSLSIEACFEAGHRCPAEEQGPRWVKKDVKVILSLKEKSEGDWTSLNNF